MNLLAMGKVHFDTSATKARRYSKFEPGLEANGQKTKTKGHGQVKVSDEPNR